MTRETLKASLVALNSSIEKADGPKKPMQSDLLRFNMTLMHGILSEQKKAGEEIDEAFLATATTIVGMFKMRDAEREDARVGLASIKSGIDIDAASWQSERETLESVIGTLASKATIGNTLRTEPVVQDRRHANCQTLFSEAGGAILAARKTSLNAKDGDATRYQERLEATLSAFVNIIGDRSLEYYLPIHLQDFANVMARLPKNRTKHREFDGLSLVDVAAKNDGLKKGKQPRLSKTTVSGHLSEIKSIWAQATAGVEGVKDITKYRVTTPKAAQDAIDREALPMSSLNTWMQSAASTRHLVRNPGKAWLPVVGLLTGMRLAEILFLQKSDFVVIDGQLVIDLREPLLIQGKKVPRPIKGPTSKRIVAIHPLLRTIGFLDFVNAVRSPNGFLFSQFHKAQDPADAAQKQLSHWMQSLKIHVPQKHVFHSLRHNAKHWIREELGELIADRQMGHAPKSVGGAYGFKSLEHEQILKFTDMRAPPRVDFTVFPRLATKDNQ